MLVSDNEFGAPWNDQFYRVTLEDEDGLCWDEILVLSGPKNYDIDDLYTAAENAFINYEVIEVCPY